MPDIFVAPEEKKVEKIGMGIRYETVAERLAKERKTGKVRTFNILPRRTRFENQEQREKIILLLRQHWITQVHWVVGAFLGIFVPLVFKWVPILDFMTANYQLMTIIGWYLLLIAYVYEKFISWYYQVFIITDERIIDINFSNLIYKELSEAKIDNIEDVSYHQGGMLRAAFNFGDVVMQTAGAEREFMIESAPEPNRIVKIMNELKLEEEHEKMIGKVR
ncbi:MAG: hypothetical protein NTZ93_04360 [Candidatus Beckwithbacteria bacterium]|nr:hypothetical protein [Candidatus Beckwithbacteria bacterium]